MRAFLLLVCLVLSGCTNQIQTPENRVEQFYIFYLNALTSEDTQHSSDSPQLREYVAQDTLVRLKEIQKIYEQEIVNSDYFTYGQDYTKEWIPGLKIGQAIDFMGGKSIDVWIGTQDGKNQHLVNYLRMEDGEWKVYRVRSATDNYEQYIFDDNAITAAKTNAVEIKH